MPDGPGNAWIYPSCCPHRLSSRIHLPDMVHPSAEDVSARDASVESITLVAILIPNNFHPTAVVSLLFIRVGVSSNYRCLICVESMNRNLQLRQRQK